MWGSPWRYPLNPKPGNAQEKREVVDQPGVGNNIVKARTLWVSAAGDVDA